MACHLLFLLLFVPLTQWPECLPVQEEARGSIPLRNATTHLYFWRGSKVAMQRIANP